MAKLRRLEAELAEIARWLEDVETAGDTRYRQLLDVLRELAARGQPGETSTRRPIGFRCEERPA